MSGVCVIKKFSKEPVRFHFSDLRKLFFIEPGHAKPGMVHKHIVGDFPQVAIRYFLLPLLESVPKHGISDGQGHDFRRQNRNDVLVIVHSLFHQENHGFKIGKTLFQFLAHGKSLSAVSVLWRRIRPGGGKGEK